MTGRLWKMHFEIVTMVAKLYVKLLSDGIKIILLLMSSIRDVSFKLCVCLSVCLKFVDVYS